MRTIKDLIESTNQKVWFHLGNNEVLKTNFINEVNELIDSSNQPLTMDTCGNIMSIGTDLQWRYVSMLIWTSSFQPDVIYLKEKQPPLKVDYVKYLRGEQDYLITELGY